MVFLAIPVGLLIGLSLGTLGGGGSILTVPALVYLMGMDARAATTGSLIIVGVTALMAMFAHRRHGRVRFTQGIVFGLIGTIGAVAGTRLSLAVPPDVLLAGFAVLMLAVAALMLTRKRVPVGGGDLDRDDPVPQPARDPDRHPGASRVPAHRVRRAHHCRRPVHRRQQRRRAAGVTATVSDRKAARAVSRQLRRRRVGTCTADSWAHRPAPVRRVVRIRCNWPCRRYGRWRDCTCESPFEGSGGRRDDFLGQAMVVADRWSGVLVAGGHSTGPSEGIRLIISDTLGGIVNVMVTRVSAPHFPNRSRAACFILRLGQ